MGTGTALNSGGQPHILADGDAARRVIFGVLASKSFGRLTVLASRGLP